MFIQVGGRRPCDTYYTKLTKEEWDALLASGVVLPDFAYMQQAWMVGGWTPWNDMNTNPWDLAEKLDEVQKRLEERRNEKSAERGSV
jgi:hypothetical protein